MEVTPQEYQSMVKRVSDPSPMWKNMVWAFVVGGLICTLGQAMLHFWNSAGLQQKDAATATSVTLIALAALLTGLHLYDKIAKHAGAGTLVPITGFSNSIASPALEFKSDDRVIIGTSQKHHEIKVDVLV